MQIITNFKEGKVHIPIPEATIAEYFEKKNPDPLPCQPLEGKLAPM